MFYVVAIPKDPKTAKVIAKITGIAFVIVLGIYLFVSFQTSERMKKWPAVVSTVSAYDTTDSSNVWTEFTWEYNGQTYVERQKGHSYWMYAKSEILLRINPDHPETFFVERNAYVWRDMFLMFVKIIGAFYAAYQIWYFVLKYIIQRKKEKTFYKQ